MADVEDILQRAEKARSAGRIWRAKEILRGNIGNRGYAPRLYEAYGELLLETGERLEAGKYLLLSGERKEEYQDAITLFLERYENAPARQIVMRFPRGARLRRRADYPEPLRSELRDLGVADELPRARKKPYDRDHDEGALLFWVGCFAVALLIMVLSLVGLGTIIGWFT